MESSQIFLATIGALAAIALIAYGIKRYFDYRAGKGKETSNAPIRQAIASLLIAFLTMAGLAPLVIDVLVQLLIIYLG